MVDRMKAKAIEVEASYLSPVPHPQEIANFILSAARAIGRTPRCSP